MRTSKKNQIAKVEENKSVIVAPAVEPKLSQETLDSILALNISDSLKKNADKKSIFKKDFNNKSDRTKCRTKLINAISLYLLFLSKGNNEKAEEEKTKIIDCAKHYYIAEDSFKNYLDYCSENMDENKKELIKKFILVNAELSAIAE